MEKKKPKVIRILLLGETGVGKSTFINAIANYLSFQTLDDAINGEVICHIPVSFTLFGEDEEEHLVSLGECDNESFELGASSTQDCRTYIFKFENFEIHIIDTPGIGDTRGIKIDQVNMENILAYLSRFDELHAIGMLLKPNNARLTATFEFCIKQLFAHLERSAKENIIFIFTNSRGTFYKPGDTGPALKQVLRQITKLQPGLNIKYTLENRFCLDNEAFRFLVALKNHIEFPQDVQEDFATSWEKSANECLRMFRYIFQLTPHQIRETVSVNEARRIILALSKPLIDISENISLNRTVLEQHKEMIQRSVFDIEALQALRFIPIVDLEIQYFDEPRTVCASKKCRTVIQVGGITKYHYQMICHDPCHLKTVSKEIVGDSSLAKCTIMKRGICTKCGCPYSSHMHIYYTTTQVQRETVNEVVENQVITRENAKVEAEKMVAAIENKLKLLKESSDNITRSTAIFANFLRRNAIAPYNDSFEKYIQLQIKNQELLLNAGGPHSQQLLQALEAQLKEYQQQVAILETISEDSTGPTLTTDMIFEEIKKVKQTKTLGDSKVFQFLERHQELIEKPLTAATAIVHQKPVTPSVMDNILNWGREIFLGPPSTGITSE